jgi:cytochrome c oxidase subunit II
MTGLLIFLAVFLIFVVLFQFARTSELLGIIKDDKDYEKSYRFQGNMALIFLVLGMAAFIWSIFYFKGRFLPESASVHGHYIDSAFNTTMFFVMVVFFITEILLFFFVFKYRQNKNRKAFYYPVNNKLEITWTIIPAIVLTFLIVQGLTSWFKITADPPEDRIEFEVTGKQFDWIIRYPGQDNELGKRGPLSTISADNILGMDWNDPSGADDFIADKIVLPLNKPVLVRINALDVLHSFFLPHFRVKMDAVPGTPTTFWFIPTITTKEMREKLENPDFNYELACAELCGRGHSSMRKVVEIVTGEEYKAWIEGQKPYKELVGQVESDNEPVTTQDLAQTMNK